MWSWFVYSIIRLLPEQSQIKSTTKKKVPLFPNASWSFESLKEQNNFMSQRRAGGAPNTA